MPSETAKASLGYVTSYGAAKRGGYQGTYEKWCALMAEVADHLEQNIQLNEDSQAAKAAAETAELEAETAALTAESWAKGTRGGTAVPDTDPAYNDNAKYYADEAEYQKGLAVQASQVAAQMAGQAEGHSTDAEAWAKGTRGGEDVESGDDAYQNNAKYFSEQSAGSATEAAGSASTAEGWATGGSGGTGGAQNNAKYYSEQAASSAQTAAAMGTNFAPEFSSSTAYSAGDYVLYQGTLHQFTADHAAGAWVGTDAAVEKIAPVVGNLAELLSDVESAIGNEETELLSNYTRASYWSVETSVAELKSAATYIAYDAVELEQDTNYIGYIYQGTSVKQDPLVIVDENYNILNRYRGKNSQYNTFEIRIDNPLAKYALITGYSASNPCSFKKIKLNNISENIANITAELTTQENSINKLNKKNITESKHLSIIGDSISALQGTLPEGNLAYYTANRNYGVETVNDIWWGIVADTLGMNVLVNNSWSGSRVCDPNYAEGDAVPASYPARCQALDDGTHDPDYVIIAMGVNDYSYNSLLGEWDGKTMPVDDVDFSQSYALMINRINSKYPNAKIFCLSPWFVQRGQDKGINYTNSQAAHLTESKYGDVIRKLCEMLGAIYIDSYVGFNRYNYYPTYCEDSAETPTHPNKAGQVVMGKVIAEKIRTLIF